MIAVTGNEVPNSTVYMNGLLNRDWYLDKGYAASTAATRFTAAVPADNQKLLANGWNSNSGVSTALKLAPDGDDGTLVR